MNLAKIVSIGFLSLTFSASAGTVGDDPSVFLVVHALNRLQVAMANCNLDISGVTSVTVDFLASKRSSIGRSSLEDHIERSFILERERVPDKCDRAQIPEAKAFLETAIKTFDMP
jgi:hypothetical protein